MGRCNEKSLFEGVSREASIKRDRQSFFGDPATTEGLDCFPRSVSWCAKRRVNCPCCLFTPVQSRIGLCGLDCAILKLCTSCNIGKHFRPGCRCKLTGQVAMRQGGCLDGHRTNLVAGEHQADRSHPHDGPTTFAVVSSKVPKPRARRQG